MKKLLYILIFTTFLYSCEKTYKKKFNKTEFSFIGFNQIGKELNEINLDSISNFNELLTEIDKTICEDKIAIIKFETDSSIYKIKPMMSYCSERAPDIWCYSLRDVVYLTSDSIFVNYKLKYPLDSLKHVLRKHIKNTENDENYPKKGKTGFLSINIDKMKSISRTKNVFEEIITNFNEINKVNNDTLNLMIFLQGYGMFPEVK